MEILWRNDEGKVEHNTPDLICKILGGVLILASFLMCIFATRWHKEAEADREAIAANYDFEYGNLTINMPALQPTCEVGPVQQGAAYFASPPTYPGVEPVAPAIHTCVAEAPEIAIPMREGGEQAPGKDPNNPLVPPEENDLRLLPNALPSQQDPPPPPPTPPQPPAAGTVADSESEETSLRSQTHTTEATLPTKD